MTIRELRESLGISQLALAMKIGMTPATLYRYEAGVVVPPYPRLRLIADTLGVSVDDIDLVKSPKRERVAS